MNELVQAEVERGGLIILGSREILMYSFMNNHVHVQLKDCELVARQILLGGQNLAIINMGDDTSIRGRRLKFAIPLEEKE